MGTNGLQSRAHSAGGKSVEEEENDDFDISPEYLKHLAQEYADVEHPLFMAELPHDTSTNADLEALQQLLVDGEDAESLALKYKNVGNEYIAQGPKFNDAAINSYTNGIKMKCDNAQLNSTLHSNRALVYFKKGMYVECVNDCRAAIQCNANNEKAYFRGGLASLALDLYSQAVGFCHQYVGATLPNVHDKHEHLLNDKTFSQLYLKILEKIKAAEIARKRLQESPKSKASCDEDAKVDTDMVTKWLRAQGIKRCKDIYNIPHGREAVLYIKDECLHGSCLLIYDEYQSSDYIIDVDYDNCMDDYVDTFLQDGNGGYSFSSLDSKCYYEVEEGVLYQVDMYKPLKHVLQETKVAYKVAAFHFVHLNVNVLDMGFTLGKFPKDGCCKNS